MINRTKEANIISDTQSNPSLLSIVGSNKNNNKPISISILTHSSTEEGLVLLLTEALLYIPNQKGDECDRIPC